MRPDNAGDWLTVPPLTYDLVGDRYVLRPLVWLLLLVPLPGLFDSVVTIWPFFGSLHSAGDVQHAWVRLTRLNWDSVALALQVMRIPAATATVLCAAALLRGGSLNPLRRTYLTTAILTLAIAVTHVAGEWSDSARPPMRLERRLQAVVVRSGAKIEATLMPVAAFVLLWKLTRKSPAGDAAVT